MRCPGQRPPWRALGPSAKTPRRSPPEGGGIGVCRARARRAPECRRPHGHGGSELGGGDGRRAWGAPSRAGRCVSHAPRGPRARRLDSARIDMPPGDARQSSLGLPPCARRPSVRRRPGPVPIARRRRPPRPDEAATPWRARSPTPSPIPTVRSAPGSHRSPAATRDGLPAGPATARGARPSRPAPARHHRRSGVGRPSRLGHPTSPSPEGVLVRTVAPGAGGVKAGRWGRGRAGAGTGRGLWVGVRVGAGAWGSGAADPARHGAQVGSAAGPGRSPWRR